MNCFLIVGEKNFDLKQLALRKEDRSKIICPVRDILEGIEDYTEGALINTNQSKTFDRINNGS